MYYAILIKVFSKSLLSMFTISQFLQIHRFKVGDTLERILLGYFYIGSQSSEGMNYLPGFSRIHIASIFLNIYSCLSNCRVYVKQGLSTFSQTGGVDIDYDKVDISKIVVNFSFIIASFQVNLTFSLSNKSVEMG